MHIDKFLASEIKIMSLTERGIVYRASRRAYIGNYILAILLVIFFFLLYVRFVYPIYGIGFTFFPHTINEMVPTLTILGMLAVIALLFDEPILAGIIRYYTVTNNEVIKIEGILRKKRVVIPFGNVADVTVKKSIFGRVFNYGDLEITGFREAIYMKAMINPELIQKIIQNKINMFRRHMIGKGKTESSSNE